MVSCRVLFLVRNSSRIVSLHIDVHRSVLCAVTVSVFDVLLSFLYEMASIISGPSDPPSRWVAGGGDDNVQVLVQEI